MHAWIAHSHTHTVTHTHTQTHTNTYTHTNTHKHTHIHKHTHKHTHTYTNTHTNTHTHTHARTDRTVILGNHRDAWVFGAVDPNSGTAALIEIARAFSVLRSYGRMLDMIHRAWWISDLGL